MGMQPLRVRVPDEDYDDIINIAKRDNITVSEAARLLITWGLESYENSLRKSGVELEKNS